MQAIAAWAREHGRAPSWEEWRISSERHPGAGTIVRRFGSWPAALKAAGLRPQVLRARRWEKDAVVKALRRFEQEHGRPPRQVDSPSLTSASRTRRRSGATSGRGAGARGGPRGASVTSRLLANQSREPAKRPSFLCAGSDRAYRSPCCFCLRRVLHHGRRSRLRAGGNSPPAAVVLRAGSHPSRPSVIRVVTRREVMDTCVHYPHWIGDAPARPKAAQPRDEGTAFGQEAHPRRDAPRVPGPTATGHGWSVTAAVGAVGVSGSRPTAALRRWRAAGARHHVG